MRLTDGLIGMFSTSRPGLSNVRAFETQTMNVEMGYEFHFFVLPLVMKLVQDGAPVHQIALPGRQGRPPPKKWLSLPLLVGQQWVLSGTKNVKLLTVQNTGSLFGRAHILV